MSGNKLRVDENITVGQLSMLIRKRLRRIDSHQALFMFFGEGCTLCAMSETIGSIYARHGDIDTRTLDATITLENAFG